MQIKVCGMGDTKKMHQIATKDIEIMGFIFYDKSPRYVVGKIDANEIIKLPHRMSKIGVFVNESFNKIASLAKTYDLDGIQLHGKETPQLCKMIQSMGLMVIKAFSLEQDKELPKFEAYSPWVDYFLFDTPSPMHGGTGKKFDWELLNMYSGDKPFFLSGGIGPDDADKIKSIQQPQFAGIDINSAFEIEPGIKDIELIDQFIQKVR